MGVFWHIPIMVIKGYDPGRLAHFNVKLLNSIFLPKTFITQQNS